MRATLLLLALPLLALRPSSEPQTLAFGLPEGARVEKRFESRTKLRLVERSVTLNGEDLSEGEEVEIEVSLEEERVFLDAYRRVEGGRPLVLVREHSKLAGKELSEFRAEGMQHEEKETQESELEGLDVRFTWDEGREDYLAAFDGEEGGDAELLLDLVADTDLLGFLPSDEVSKGDSWKLDPKLFRHLVEPGGGVRLLSEGEEAEEERAMERQLNEHLDGTLVATFGGLREEQGRRVGVIQLEADLDTHAESSEVDEDGDPVVRRMEVGFEIEGEILWDLAAGRPHAYALSGEMELSLVETSTWEDEEEGTVSWVVRMAFEGETSFAGRWKAAE